MSKTTGLLAKYSVRMSEKKGILAKYKVRMSEKTGLLAKYSVRMSETMGLLAKERLVLLRSEASRVWISKSLSDDGDKSLRNVGLRQRTHTAVSSIRLCNSICCKLLNSCLYFNIILPYTRHFQLLSSLLELRLQFCSLVFYWRGCIGFGLAPVPEPKISALFKRFRKYTEYLQEPNNVIFS